MSVSTTKPSDEHLNMELGSESGHISPKVEASDMDPSQITWLEGWRKWGVFVALLLAMFLGNLEVTIVNTALVSIASDLGGFDKTSWIISANLLGFVGVVIINAKLSDIFGRKAVLLSTFAIFIVFSAACGAAQTPVQLIVFRAFQGIGGAGMVSMPVPTLYDMVPPEQLPIFSTFIGLALVIVNIIGPILGGVISQDSTWRWVFLLNVPIAVPAALLLAIGIPQYFPYHGNPNAPRRNMRTLMSKATLSRIDLPGCALLLISTVFFVAAFQEAGLEFAWRSGFVISLLVLSGLGFIAFIVYERYVTFKDGVVEPVFPWRFVVNRTWLGLLVTATFAGASWIIPIYQIPQRLQVLYGLSPLAAAVRVLPFSAPAGVSMIVASSLAKKGHPPIYFLLFVAVCQIIGLALLSTVGYTSGEGIPARYYGYQVLAGFAGGPAFIILHLMVPWVVEARDKSVGSAALTQARYMGAVMGLSIVTNVMNNFVRTRMSGVIPQNDIAAILESPGGITGLPADIRDQVRGIYADGFNLQMKVLTGLAAGQILGGLLLWRKVQVTTVVPEEVKSE